MMIRFMTGAVILCVALTGTSSAFASTAGRISGRITDENGRALAGARVHVTGTGAVGVYDATADAEGFYQIPGLPALEPLEARAESQGKTAVVYSGIRIRGGIGVRRDFRLRPSGVQEFVVLLDARIPYHRIALDGVRDTLTGTVTVFELSGDGRSDAAGTRHAVAQRPNAVIAIGSGAARLARREIKDAPVIYTLALDPVSEDLRAANLCGVLLNGGLDDQLKQLAVLRPQARRLATVYDPRRLARGVKELRRSTRDRGMSLRAVPARGSREIISALDALSRGVYGEIDAFFLLLDPQLIDLAAFERIRQFTEAEALVFVVPDRSLVAAGGTFSFAPGFKELGAYAARLALNVVAGRARPAEIGVAFPTTRYFSLNPFEAGRLGIKIPEPARAR